MKTLVALCLLLCVSSENALGGSPEFLTLLHNGIVTQVRESVEDVTASWVKHASDRLYYYGARYYDPRTSVWQSTDPLFMEQGPIGFNPYHYSRLNPVRYNDPDGRHFMDAAHPVTTQNSINFANTASAGERNAQLAMGVAVTVGSIGGLVAAQGGLGMGFLGLLPPAAVPATVATAELGTGAGLALSDQGGPLGTAGRTAAKEVQIVAKSGAFSQLISRVFGRAKVPQALVPQKKWSYIFGLARGSKNAAHNAPRTAQNVGQLNRIGVFNNKAGRKVLQEHFDEAVASSSNVVGRRANEFGKFETRESLLMGPNGGLKIRSDWQVLDDGTREFKSFLPIGGE